MKIENCAHCFEIYETLIDGPVCEHTKQPIFTMLECPMGNPNVKTELDPAYVWFPTGKFGEHYCKTTAFGNKCQFYETGLCVIPNKTRTPVVKMKFCPLPRFNEAEKRIYSPLTNYELIRNDRRE